MRIPLLVAALAGLLAQAAQAGDVTAHYTPGAHGGPTLTVQANDRGDSRLSMGDQMAVITRDGVTYLVMADLRGPFAIRQDDFVAAVREAVRRFAERPAPGPDEAEAIDSSSSPAAPEPARPDEPSSPAEADSYEPASPYSPTPAGTETVAGRTGTVWLVRPRPADAPPDWRSLELVISTDADLAPIGRALARQWSPAWDFIAGSMDEQAGFSRAVRSIVERGTILRMGNVMRLRSVEQGPVPDSTYALPGPVLSREQFMARSGAVVPPRD